MMRIGAVSALLLFALAALPAAAVTAVDDAVLGAEGSDLTIPWPALQENDDLGTDRLAWQVVVDAQPTSGSLDFEPQKIVYHPGPGFSGQDTFTYHLEGQGGTSNTATVRVHVSPLWSPIEGDWDGDGDTEVGLYKNVPSPYFVLCSSIDEHPPCLKYPVSAAYFGFLPVAGNWDGIGPDEVGLYSPLTGRFYLLRPRPHQTALLMDSFKLGQGGKGNLPLAGNWDSIGPDSVGVRIAPTGSFGLRNDLSNGAYDSQLNITGTQSSWVPFSGRWGENGSSAVGLFDPSTHKVHLRGGLSTGPADWEVEIDFGEDFDTGGISPVSGSRHLNGGGGFSLTFFSRPQFSFLLYGADGLRPTLKVVVPTDPNGG